MFCLLLRPLCPKFEDPFTLLPLNESFASKALTCFALSFTLPFFIGLQYMVVERLQKYRLVNTIFHFATKM